MAYNKKYGAELFSRWTTGTFIPSNPEEIDAILDYATARRSRYSKFLEENIEDIGMSRGIQVSAHAYSPREIDELDAEIERLHAVREHIYGQGTVKYPRQEIKPRPKSSTPVRKPRIWSEQNLRGWTNMTAVELRGLKQARGTLTGQKVTDYSALRAYMAGRRKHPAGRGIYNIPHLPDLASTSAFVPVGSMDLKPEDWPKYARKVYSPWQSRQLTFGAFNPPQSTTNSIPLGQAPYVTPQSSGPFIKPAGGIDHTPPLKIRGPYGKFHNYRQLRLFDVISYDPSKRPTSGYTWGPEDYFFTANYQSSLTAEKELAQRRDALDSMLHKNKFWLDEVIQEDRKRSEQKLARKVTRLRKEYGYKYRDARLDLRPEWGNIEGRTWLFDAETMGISRGARAYELNFGKIIGGRMGRQQQVLVPLEILFGEGQQNLHSLYGRKAIEKGLMTRESLVDMFRSAYYEQAHSMNIAEKDIDRGFMGIMRQYEKMWRTFGKSTDPRFGMDSFEASRAFVFQMRKVGLHQMPHFLGANTPFDVGNVLPDILDTVKSSLRFHADKGMQEAQTMLSEVEGWKRMLSGNYDLVNHTTIAAGATQTDILAYAKTKEFQELVQQRAAIVRKYKLSLGNRASPERLLDLEEEYQRIQDIGRAPTQSGMAEILGVKSHKGFIHGARYDVKVADRIRRRIRDLPQFAKYKNMSIGELLEVTAQKGWGRLEVPRMKLDREIQSAMRGVPEATIDSGRLSGLRITSMRYAGEGRFVSGLVAPSGEAFRPTIGVASHLTRAIKTVLKTGSGEDFDELMKAHQSGLLSNPDKARQLVQIYNRRRHSDSLANIIKMIEPELTPLQRFEEATGLTNIRASSHEQLDAAGRAIKDADDAIQQAFAKLASRTEGYIRSTDFDQEMEATRRLARYSGATGKGTEFQSIISKITHRQLGTLGKETTKLGAYGQALATEAYRRQLFAALSSGKAGIHEMAQLVPGAQAYGLGKQIDWISGKIAELGNLDIRELVDVRAQAELAPAEFARLKAVAADLFPDAGLLPTKDLTHIPIGLEARLAAESTIINSSMSEFIPEGKFQLPGDSAPQQMESFVKQRTELLARELRQSIIDSGQRSRGIWDVRNAVDNLSSEQIKLANQKVGPGTEQFIKALKGIGINERSSALSDIIPEAQFGKFLGWLTAESGKRFDEAYSVQQIYSSPKMMSIQHMLTFGDDIAEDLPGSIGGFMPEELMDVKSPLTFRMEKAIAESDKAFSTITSTKYWSAFRNSVNEVLPIAGGNNTREALILYKFLHSPGGRTHFALADANKELTNIARQLKYADEPKAIEGLMRQAQEILFKPARGSTIRAGIGTGWGALPIGEYTPDASGLTINGEPAFHYEIKGGIDDLRSGLKEVDATITGLVDEERMRWSAAKDYYDRPTGAEWIKRGTRTVHGKIPGMIASAAHEIPELIQTAERSATRARWGKVPGSLFGVEGLVNAEAISAPSLGAVGQGRVLANPRILVARVGKDIRRAVVGQLGEDWIPAETATYAEHDFGFFKGMRARHAISGIEMGAEEATTPFVKWGGLKETLHDIGTRIRSQSQANMDAAESRIPPLNYGRTAQAEDIFGDAARAGIRRTAESAGRRLKPIAKALPSNWKVMAAGIAGLAALTMLRRERPLLPEEQGAFNPNMAYPMGFQGVGQQTTYMAPPPTQGVKASISGVVGPDFNIEDVRGAFGGMGITNININDNTRNLTQRDIDRMMRNNIG